MSQQNLSCDFLLDWEQICSLSILTDTFPGGPGLASLLQLRVMEVVVTSGDTNRCAKLQSNRYHQQTNIHFFTGRMPFLLPNQQCQSTEGKKSHSMDLLTPNSPGGLPTLSLTTNSSWLPRGRVAMPLISPLMPVPKVCLCDVWYNWITTRSCPLSWSYNITMQWRYDDEDTILLHKKHFRRHVNNEWLTSPCWLMIGTWYSSLTS